MCSRRSLAIVLAFTLIGTSLPGQELSVERGGSAVIPASFDNAFTLEFDGDFQPERVVRWTARRYIYDAGPNQSIDLFEKGRFRLANTKIFFRSATQGRIRNPEGEKDHYAEVDSFQGRHRVRIAYDPGERRCRIWIDEAQEGDFNLEIRKTGRVGRLVFVGFAGKVRLLKGAVAPGGAGGLDTVLAAGAGAVADANTLSARSPGTRTVTAAADGQLRVTAKLSTYQGAVLSVTIARDGVVRRWLRWERQHGTDPAPLQVDGKPRVDSMYERDPGDFSPREVEEVTGVRKGDVLTFQLEGDFGEGSPLLRYAFPAGAP